MMERFEESKECIMKNPTQFNIFIEDVCETKARELSIVQETRKRKNSFEGKNNAKISGDGLEIKTTIYEKAGEKPVVNIPKNNPLQEMSMTMNLNK